MSKRIDYAIWSICTIFLILAIVVVALFNGKNGQVNYKTYTVSSREETYYSGVVAPNQKQSVSDKPLQGETLTSTPMKNGEKVTKGQTLFTFNKDMSTQISSVNAEIQQLQSTNASLQSASSVNDTSSTSSVTGDSSDSSTIGAFVGDDSTSSDTSTPTTSSATDNSAEIVQNNAQITSDQNKLAELNQEANRTVTAPIAGTLIKETNGSYYVYGKPEVLGNINEYALTSIHNNDDVQVYKNNGKKMYGTITGIDKAPYNSSSSVSYYHFEVTADQNLTYGMHVQIKTSSKGYKIPSDAVHDDDYVYVLKNGKKKKTYLNLNKNGDFYYTHSGLKAGQKLVLD
ncbi:ABC transporter ATP-binding protein [Companilactobacillus versmoldensis]|uniref:ABC transporter ATP-binding protein n=1 Tax=Companilactobacillus versmoldensis DSM 14857 = KCTC 3814 TaxID=1423815 RepID=A0A0R1SFH8_9LACO|nr:ABC transporter ATP-binding protein [Companilactobacillus versmoldensis]KRL68157.1 ABC transporter ATP-binding protein [Companilactobacillus versmoldensis DSM 14857 = KCTC 3814]